MVIYEVDKHTPVTGNGTVTVATLTLALAATSASPTSCIITAMLSGVRTTTSLLVGLPIAEYNLLLLTRWRFICPFPKMSANTGVTALIQTTKIKILKLNIDAFLSSSSSMRKR